MKEKPLFLGLNRKSKVFGLPLDYFIVMVLIAVVPFILTEDMRFLLLFVVLYPPLWFIADRYPNLFEIAQVVLSRTPRTRNHKHNGGDRYVS